MKTKKILPARLRQHGAATGVVLLLAADLPGSAMAASINYAFTTGTNPIGAPSAALTAIAGLGASGSFTYDSAGTIIVAGTSGSAYQGLSSLVGTVGGYSFSDSNGIIGTQNDAYPPLMFDLLQLAAEPPTGMSGSYNLTGFTVSGLTLANVRLFWIENVIGDAPDFLSSNNLPSALPTFTGRLALDFVASTYTPVDGQTAPNQRALTTVFFDGLKVTPVTSVPVPASLPLFAFSLVSTMIARRRKIAK